ncbi:hypothetical protein SO802_030645 [Lithocarpus litseifolius]|uniref:peptidylprolyl isomerase n=1 Tax=Lithocarpus litseifolius TaxID=425828 RepID=A0AAW2BL58_9ROSI
MTSILLVTLTDGIAFLLVVPFLVVTDRSAPDHSAAPTVIPTLGFVESHSTAASKRLLIFPPELAFGSKGVQKIPPNATIELDVELLDIKQSPFGSPVKIVEG